MAEETLTGVLRSRVLLALLPSHSTALKWTDCILLTADSLALNIMLVHSRALVEEERKADKSLENIIHKVLNSLLLVILGFYEISNTK